MARVNILVPWHLIVIYVRTIRRKIETTGLTGRKIEIQSFALAVSSLVIGRVTFG